MGRQISKKMGVISPSPFKRHLEHRSMSKSDDSLEGLRN